MSKRTAFIAAIAACAVIGGGWVNAANMATTAPTDAAELYLRAAQWITAISPAASNLTYPDYPPFDAEWNQMAQAAWDKNAAVRLFAHEARSIDQANWPDEKRVMYLNSCRALANDLGDAALYEHLHGNDAGAGETMLDLLHLPAMLRLDPQRRNLVRPLVAGGIDDLAANRLMMIASGVRLTNDPGDRHDLQLGTARKLIELLLDQQTAKEQFAQVGVSATGAPVLDTRRSHQFMETLSRINAERTFAALSLGCHLFQFENHRWPARLDELVPADVTSVPVDPWGDGKQTFGYVVVKGGLPDGSDRPLLYDRCQWVGELFYRRDEPEYGFYSSYLSKLTPSQQKRGGQFRDVAGWVPGPNSGADPTTRPLN